MIKKEHASLYFIDRTIPSKQAKLQDQLRLIRYGKLEVEEEVEDEDGEKNEAMEDPYQDPEVRKDLIEEAKETWLTNQFIARPCQVCCIFYIGLILLAYGSIKYGYFNVDTEGDRDYQVWDDPATMDYEKFAIASEYISNFTGKAKADVRSQRSDIVFMLYQQDKGGPREGLMNHEGFKKMYKFEDDLMNSTQYKELCRAKPNNTDE